MEQGHSELFWVARGLQLTPGSHLTYLQPLTGFMDVLSSCGHALSRGMGPNSTQDGTGKQLPLVTGPVGERGDDWLHAMGPHLPRLTMAAQ